jgi:hypothetical protein
MIKQIFPAEELDAVLGTNLATKWNLPEGWDEHTLGEMFMDDDSTEAQIDKAIDQLFELNPTLEALAVQYPNHASNVVWGILSRFNYDDIEFFISKWIPDNPGDISMSPQEIQELIENIDKLHGEYQAKMRKIEKLLPVSTIGWVPSPKSFEVIETRAKERFKSIISDVSKSLDERIAIIWG